MEGTRLGPYVVERELGTGGMGTVWRARVEEPAAGLAAGDVVALKVVHRHLLGTAGYFKRFLREAELGRRVRHPNVVATLDVDEIERDGRTDLFLVMEYVEGRTLRALLGELRVVPETLLREIARQAADGLAAIHAAGIVHRDLKPENVLLTADHKVRIMDLGVARLVEESFDLTRPGEFVGSLLYAAPEQFRSEKTGPASDLYSMGVLLYELATGVNPFEREDVGRVIAAHLGEVPPRADTRNPELSPFLSELLASLVAKTPGDRFPSAQFLRDVLERGEASPWWSERETRVLESTVSGPRIHVRRATALYGRDEEMTLLRTAWGRAIEGHGSTVLVEGEPGIGKTRLVDALVAELRGTGARILYGAWTPSGGIGALSDAVLGHFGGARLVEEIAPLVTETPRLVPAFAALLRGESPPQGTEPLGTQAVHAVVCHLMRGLARDAPLLWVVDDLHLAEPQSRQIVLSMARAVEGRRVLLVATTRPGLPDDEVAAFSRLGNLQRLALGRLSPREVMQLLHEALANRTVAERLGGPIAYQSDGIPYFVLEMLEELKRTDLLRRRPDGSFETTGEVRRVDVPSAVRDLVHARLGALTDEERAILDAAAVQGFEFEADLVARIREMKRVVVLERLAGVERRTGLVRGRGGRSRFDHHQVQEVLYDEMPAELREEYHTLVGDALREKADAASPGEAPSGELAARIAHHHLRGHRKEAARDVLAAAMTHLGSLYRQAAALELAERALSVPGLLEDREREITLLHRAGALDFLGRREDQRQCLDEALRLADASGDPARRARVRRHLGWHLLQVADAAAAQPVLEEAVALARTAGDAAEEAAATGHLASVHLQRGENDESLALYERQLALGREHRLLADMAFATGNLGVLLRRLGRYDDALQSYERALAVHRERGDRRGEAFTTTNLGALLSDHGRHEEARECYERALAILREIGDRRAEAAVTGNLGVVWKTLGRYEDALVAHEAHRALARETGSREHEAIALVNLGPLYAATGDAPRAKDVLQEARAVLHASGAKRAECHAIHGLGEVAEQEGRFADARALHEEALALRREVRDPKGVGVSLLASGRVLAALGERPDAVARLEECLRLAQEIDDPDLVVTATCHLAALGARTAADAEFAFARDGHRLRKERIVEARHAAWRATGNAAHLAEARRALRELLEHAPAASRAAMAERVPLHRAVLG